jgi:hypothetical protein
MVHIQGFTADYTSPIPYVIQSTRSGSSRCHSRESRLRGVLADPALVKVSIFIKDLFGNSPGNSLTNVFQGTRISPAALVQQHLRPGHTVLFLGEGDATWARSCLDARFDSTTEVPRHVGSPPADLNASQACDNHNPQKRYMRQEPLGYIGTYQEYFEWFQLRAAAVTPATENVERRQTQHDRRAQAAARSAKCWSHAWPTALEPTHLTYPRCTEDVVRSTYPSVEQRLDSGLGHAPPSARVDSPRASEENSHAPHVLAGQDRAITSENDVAAMLEAVVA